MICPRRSTSQEIGEALKDIDKMFGEMEVFERDFGSAAGQLRAMTDDEDNAGN